MARINDADWDVYIQRVVNYLNTHQARLQVNAIDLATLNSQMADWNTHFLPSKDDRVRTKVITEVKTKTRQKIERQIRRIKGDTPDSLLTDADRQTLGWKKANFTNRLVTAEQRDPVIMLISLAHLTVELNIRHPDRPEVRRLPYRHKILLESFIGEPWLAKEKIYFNQIHLFGTSRRVLFFAPEDRGKEDYFRARYISPSGQAGTGSQVLMVMIN